MKTINKKDNFKDKRLNKRKFFSPFAFLFVLTLSIIFQTPNLFANSLGGPFVQGYLLGASMALKALLKQEVIYPGYTYRTDARSFYLRAVKMRIFEEQIRNMIHQHKNLKMDQVQFKREWFSPHVWSTFFNSYPWLWVKEL